LVSARNFSDATLQAARAAIETGKTNLEAAASAQDFEKALGLVKDLETKVDAYLKDAKTKEDEYKKKGDEISKKLDDANYFTRDNVAREAVKGLSADDIQHLPTPVRNRLMQELEAGYTSDDDKAALKKLYSAKYLDPEFEKIDNAKRQAMLDKIKKDPAFKTARENWDHLSDKERAEVMNKVIDYQAAEFGIPHTTVEPYDETDPLMNGYYKHSEGKLYLSKDMMKNKGFDKALETSIHENDHRYQSTLVDKLNAGEIKEGDPLYNQAMTFKLNNAYYVQPPGDEPSADTGDEYFTQPMENHSRINGDAIRTAGVGK
jgi:hypothetical protein